MVLLSNALKTRPLVGIGFAVLIAATMVLIFASLLSVPPTFSNTASPSAPIFDIAHLLRMGLLQASASTALALFSGIAIAWALNRLSFPGRELLISMLATAIVAPGLVIALGLISVWGNAGWVNQFLSFFTQKLPGSIFGLHGILLAHTVLNGAFAAHLLLSRLSAIPTQKLKTGQSLSLSSFQRFKVLDWPVISSVLPPLASIIFLLTFTSFPIVLLLGGGPANQTLEVAIYTAVRFSFDLNLAVTLALIQLAICAVIILPALFATPNMASAGTTARHNWPSKLLPKIAQFTILIITLIGFILPLLAIIFKGMGLNDLSLFTRPSFLKAVATSLTLGILSAVFTLFITIRIAMARVTITTRLWATLLSLPLFAYLLMPSLVLALGFFLALQNVGIPTKFGAPFVLLIANILLALPFAFATLSPALNAINKRYDKLSRSLNLSGVSRWKYVEWPLLGREIGLASALAFCFSLGDLAIISLFGTSDFTTLPWLMFRAMGAYRNADAVTIAALMLLLCLSVFWALPKIFQSWASNAKY